MSSPSVLLSWETVVKQNAKHPDIGVEDYCLIPEIVRSGMVAQEHANQLIFCYHHRSGRRFRLTINTTIIGEIFVTSFHRTSPRQTKAILARATLLRRHA
jgi:hypothetical protein